MAEEQLCEAFAEIMQLALDSGAHSIKDLAGCWEYAIDDRWWVAVNGHQERTRCSSGFDVPPFTAYLEYNGWPAGLLQPNGGTMAAGLGANENTFISAVQVARRRLKAAHA